MVVLRENDEGFPKISNVAPSRLQKRIGSSSWHQRIPDCDNREVKIELCGSWLGRLPYENKCRYRNVHPHSLPAGSHGFVGMATMPPALLEGEKKEERKREKLYIYLDVTHTRTHTHTLAQNCRCELCCGVHLTCKNTSTTPDRNGSVKWPDQGIKELSSPQPVSLPNWNCWKKNFQRIDTPVLGVAGCLENEGTFTPPCCLVFVGQDRQSWVSGPLLQSQKAL